jgi:small subunit ribosomal protein S9
MSNTQTNMNSTGKRKRAIARVRLAAGSGKVTVNGKELGEYFGQRLTIRKKILSPFEIVGAIDSYDVNANIIGGGIVGQADAVMYAIAKVLASLSEGNKKALKAANLLTRNSLIKESKKYGRKKARKRFQFSKR